MSTAELKTQYAAGSTLRQISNQTGLSVHYVYTRLKMGGAQLRPRATLRNLRYVGTGQVKP